MRWDRAFDAIFDPWKIPAYIAGVCFIGFVSLEVAGGVREYRAHRADDCDTRCQITKIRATIDRIESKLDKIDRRYQVGKCDLDHPFGSPFPQKASIR